MPPGDSMDASKERIIDFTPDLLQPTSGRATVEDHSVLTPQSSAVDRQGLRIKDLNAWYGRFQAIRGVNLHIKARAITALIGPSGSGKSTFLRCLNRMHEVIPGARAEGEVWFDGK